MNILNIQHATAFRGTTQVFKNFNLTIPEGQSTAIIGPNGAGKSTLMKMLAREIYPSSGSVEIFGRQRWNIWELKNQLGIVSAEMQQNYLPAATGLSVVLSGFYSSVDTYKHQQFTQVQRATAQQVIHQLGIHTLLDQPFAKMSTGQQRRHLLARALVNDPNCLILDEPTTGLDLQAQFYYLDTIGRLMRGDQSAPSPNAKTVILVTHQIQEIPPEVSHVVLLKNAKVMLYDSKQRALTSQNLSNLFDVPIKVISENGYYQVLPG